MHETHLTLYDTMRKMERKQSRSDYVHTTGTRHAIVVLAWGSDQVGQSKQRITLPKQDMLADPRQVTF